jgi:quinoprotein glucose dehydrogenase
MKWKLVLLLLPVALCCTAQAQSRDAWGSYGGDPGGQRYSTAAQIDRSNVSQLQPAWSMHTHVFDQASPYNRPASFEATPVLWKDTLFFDTPFDAVFAVDAATGAVKWSFDPKVPRNNQLYLITSRGVAVWHTSGPKKTGLCASDMILVATLDRRLIGLDAESGKLCPAFGQRGTVDLAAGVEAAEPRYLFYTSPPIVVGNTIIVGSSVADNQTLFAASGAVRGFDVHTGRQQWSWEPVRWTANQHPKLAGSGNAWAPLAADPEHDLVFLPTGSASLDYYGGFRVGDNRDADSIVALRASTGQKVWAFQLVHHDLWDYDTASQPLLFTFRGKTPAVAVTNKTGMIYVFNRLTGEPLFPIVERPVPKSTLSGEVAWPTQPFSSLPSLVPHDDLRGPASEGTAADRRACRDQMAHLREDGLFTPPSVGGTVIFPAALGGPNWGSSALDPRTNILYTRVSVLPFKVYMLDQQAMSSWGSLHKHWYAHAPEWLGGGPPREASSAYRPPDLGLGDTDGSAMRGSPYSMLLSALLAPGGEPCAKGPYGRIVATNLNTGKQLWSVAHGEIRPGIAGSPGVGGAIVTAGGLIFAASDNAGLLHAYDSSSGRELWHARLPATANATPMTYELKGRQYVVLAVGGHKTGLHDESDVVMAFALPQATNAAKSTHAAKPTHAVGAR